jgi:hypothetical protein
MVWENVLQACLLDLLGTWLDGKTKMVGLDRLHSYIKKNGNGERPRRKRTVGLFSNIPTRLCIESWSPLVVIWWSGEVEL